MKRKARCGDSQRAKVSLKMVPGITLSDNPSVENLVAESPANAPTLPKLAPQCNEKF